ncbi:hypothetical protein WA1_22295 [Scytonema hofmannii PCC 7110]|uniref:ATPase domain-containing protein n=1 Tax=Scytonema hofmannii PCC 7110 TaxID=128403 RepID=A0A139X9Q3_9CYAN|nr:ATP-binding protein [Scytonema hofmannii]KYC41424.1 hypothetical protein WA1_22295 [Scytonema hofmannii PCC 7110]
MKSGFNPDREVIKPQQLFGHNQPGALLEQLCIQLEMGTNVLLLGERRSGKTSLLQCCLSKISSSKTSGLVPVYINFYESPYIKGFASAYRWLLAFIHAAVSTKEKDKIPNDLALNKVVLNKNQPPEAYYQQLLQVEDYEIDYIFQDYLKKISEYRVGVALLIDEYEYLIRHTFEGQGFVTLRKVSSWNPHYDYAFKPLCYVIAGAISWDRLCDIIGSPELNNTSSTLTVNPLNFESFKQMWTQCLLETSYDLKDNIDFSKFHLGKIYDLTGGWPYYGKVIGQYICTGMNNEEDFYEALLRHFKVIWYHLTEDEKSRLLLVDQIFHKDTDGISQSLIKRGLLEVSPEGFLNARGRLWRRYIQQQEFQ